MTRLRLVLAAFTLGVAPLTLLGLRTADASMPRYALVRLARGLQSPTHVTAAPGERGRLYVVLQRGLVRSLSRGRLDARPFLDVRRKVSGYAEMGLLSIAFHPDYRPNGLVYAVFNDTADDRAVTVAEYRASAGRVDPATERVLVRVPHPDSPYHNGGQLQFGPDGKLYVSVGDGGYTRDGSRLLPDPHENAQSTDVLLGKIFRLDTTQAAPEPELVAYGLRNPWRFAFAPNGDMLIGDVGWNRVEEVDIRPRDAGLVNFGWSVYEGRTARPGAGTLNPAGELRHPAHTYGTHERGNCTIIGGYVYRGAAVRSLRGRYVFGDYCSGRIWSARRADARLVDVRLEPVKVPSLVSFGEDAAGELYAVSAAGPLYRFGRG